MRNYHPDANKKETPATPGAPAKAKRKRGQQSYGDIDQSFEKLIEAVKLVPGYSPKPESNIQIAQLKPVMIPLGMKAWFRPVRFQRRIGISPSRLHGLSA